VGTSKKQILGCIRSIRSIPPSRYKLPSDKRKWRIRCVERKLLLMFIASFANGDGTGAYPGVHTMMEAMEWSHGKVCRLLNELTELGFLETIGRVGRYGSARRIVRIDAILGAEVAPSESTIGGLAASSESMIGTTESILDSSESKKRPKMDHTVLGEDKRERQDPALSSSQSDERNSLAANADSERLVDAAVYAARKANAHALFYGKHRKELGRIIASFKRKIVSDDVVAVVGDMVSAFDEWELHHAGELVCANFVGAMVNHLVRQEAELGQTA
jgi:hypothetical protein